MAAVVGLGSVVYFPDFRWFCGLIGSCFDSRRRDSLIEGLAVKEQRLRWIHVDTLE